MRNLIQQFLNFSNFKRLIYRIMKQENRVFWNIYICCFVMLSRIPSSFAGRDDCHVSSWIPDTSTPPINYGVPQKSSKETFNDGKDLCSSCEAILPSFGNVYEYENFTKIAKKLGKVDDNIWLSLIAPRTAKSLKKTSYLWDGSYRSIFDKWKPNITFSDPCASTVDNNRYWDTVSCREKNSVICQKRDPNVCPYGFTADNSGKICYTFSTIPANASDSELYCQRAYYKSTLPIFKNSSEYGNFINHTNFNKLNRYWIGARRICNVRRKNKQQESPFLWLDKSPMEYRQWNYWEPSPYLLQACVITNLYLNYKWSDIHCSQLYPYPVCQFRLQDPTLPADQTGSYCIGIISNQILCPPGFFMENTGSICYNFLTTPANAADSEAYCKQAHNMSTLPVFLNFDEYENFLSHSNFNDTNLYWIGARRQCNSTAKNPSAFFWLDRSRMEFQWWDTVEPNDVDEACVAMNNDLNSTWMDVECSTQRYQIYPVCQFRPQSSINPVDRKGHDCFIGSPCPSRFTADRSGDICYNFLTTPANATGSEAYCKQAHNESTLPVFQSNVEYQDFISHPNFAKSTQSTYWLGARRKCNSIAKDQSAFFWADKSPIKFKWWGTNEPSTATDNCVFVLYGKNYTWADISCSQERDTVCQYRRLAPINSFNRQGSECFTNVETNIDTSSAAPMSTAPTGGTSEVRTISTSAALTVGQTTNTEIPEGTTEIQQGTTDIHQDTTEILHGTTEIHQDTTEILQGTIKIPKDISEIPQDTTEIPQDCMVSEWENYTECSVTCGTNGQITKNRRIIQISKYGGQSCPPLQQTDPCEAQHPCSPMSQLEQKVAYVLNQIGCVYLIVQVTMSLIVLAFLRSFSYRRLLQIGQEITLLLGHTFIFVFEKRVVAVKLCKVVAALLQYFFLANFMFLLLETVQCFMILANIMANESFISIKCSYFLAFGLTLIPTLLTTWIGWQNLLSPFTCWLNLDHNLSIGTLLPLFLIVVITVVTWESIGMYQINGNFLCSESLIWETKVAKHALFFKIPMNVSTWLIGVLALHYQRFSLYTVLFGMNIALGTTVFLFHPFGDQRVRQFVLKLWHYIKK